ncbi:MAG: DNA mismatch repair protein MutS, partial [Aquificaceae bacterium]
ATYDGIAVATAVAEYIAKEIKARTLFATHYHELTRLEGKVEGVVNYHMEVKENSDGSVEFLYTLKRGASSKSFGVAVAKMAGLPTKVVKRARQILALLEGERERELSEEFKPKKTYEKPSVEKVKTQTPKVEGESEIVKLLKEIDIAKTTPLEALIKLAHLKELIKG